MSGGHWDHGQFKINNIVDDLEETLADEETMGQLDKVMANNLVDIINNLKIAAINMQRLDWYISGDDGKETYHKRLNEDLKKLKQI